MLTCGRTAPSLLQVIRTFLTVYRYCYIFIFNCVSCGRQFFSWLLFFLPSLPVPGDWLVRVISDRRLWIMKQDSSLPDGSPSLLACLSSLLTDNAVHYTYVSCLFLPPDVVINTIGNLFDSKGARKVKNTVSHFVKNFLILLEILVFHIFSICIFFKYQSNSI